MLHSIWPRLQNSVKHTAKTVGQLQRSKLSDLTILLLEWTLGITKGFQVFTTYGPSPRFSWGIKTKKLYILVWRAFTWMSKSLCISFNFVKPEWNSTKLHIFIQINGLAFHNLEYEVQSAPSSKIQVYHFISRSSEMSWMEMWIETLAIL